MLIWLPALLILLAYGALMLWYRRAWIRIPEFAASNTQLPATVTVLVPVRNEAAHIGRLLQCLLQQDYPAHLRQIIVIDDASEDNTRDIVQGFEGVELIVLDNKVTRSHKKRAIEAGLALAATALGLSPAAGLSMSLLIRLRDVTLGLVGLWLGGFTLWPQQTRPVNQRIRESVDSQ